MASWATWNKRRRLFVVEQLLFLALLVVGVVLMFVGHGVGNIVTWAVFILVVTVANLVLRPSHTSANGFAEIREERKRHRS